ARRAFDRASWGTHSGFLSKSRLPNFVTLETADPRVLDTPLDNRDGPASASRTDKGLRTGRLNERANSGTQRVSDAAGDAVRSIHQSPPKATPIVTRTWHPRADG